MIFYFSGTNNSKYIAKRLSEILKEETFSINEFLKSGSSKQIPDFDKLILVSPTYSWRIPNIVKDFIEKLPNSKKDAYFIMNCGDDIGNASGYNKSICKSKSFNYKGTGKIIMPENYIALFETPSKEESLSIIDSSEKTIDLMADYIEKGEMIPENKAGFLGKFKSSLVHDLFYAFIVKDKKFYAKDSCIACSKCEEICPLNNIKLEDDKPLWQGSCTHCMACISSCPVKAIEYGKASIKRYRYLCPKI